MGLKEEIVRLVTAGKQEELEPLIDGNPAALRHLLGLSYHHDPELRRRAAWSIGRAARRHPRLVRRLIARLVWAMNDESGTNATSAPEVLAAIAEQAPRMLEGVVPELNRVAQEDDNIGAAAAGVLRRLARDEAIVAKWPEIFAGLEKEHG